MSATIDPVTCEHNRRLAYTATDWRCLDCLYMPPATTTVTVTTPTASVAALRAWVTAHGGTTKEGSDEAECD